MAMLRVVNYRMNCSRVEHTMARLLRNKRLPTLAPAALRGTARHPGSIKIPRGSRAAPVHYNSLLPAIPADPDICFAIPSAFIRAGR